MDFKEIIEPLRDLFKDEVRNAGRELGLPAHLVSRQPFPGPGLAIRIIGAVTPEKIAILQDADAIYREEVAKACLLYTSFSGNDQKHRHYGPYRRRQDHDHRAHPVLYRRCV